MEKMLMYAIPIGLGIGALYFLSRPQQVVQTGQAVSYPPTGIPTFGGDISMGAVGARETLLSLAEQQTGIPRSELIVRGLRPEDLGCTTSFNFTSTAVNTWENWISHTVADVTFISIEGVAYGGTSFSQLRIQPGARTGAFWNLSFISGLQSQLWYSAIPVIIEQNQPILIDVISNAVATEGISLIGTVCEKAGMVVA